MSSDFWSSYFSEVTVNLLNWHEDNYDFRRFGPQPNSPSISYYRDVILKNLQRNRYGSAISWLIGIITATRLVNIHRARFEWLYDHLSDDESKDTLIKVLAFRALGHA